MERKLKVGDSFDVAQWVRSPLGDWTNDYVGSQGVVYDGIFLTQHMNGKSCNRFFF